MTDEQPAKAARIGELLHLQIFLEAPDLDLDAIRLYVADRLAALYPLAYHVYFRRWHALPPGQEPGPLLGYLEWQPLVEELAERVQLAEMLGEESARVGELRRMLLVEEGIDVLD